MREQGSKAMVLADFRMYLEVVIWSGQKKLQELGPEKNNSARVCREGNMTSAL